MVMRNTKARLRILRRQQLKEMAGNGSSSTKSRRTNNFEKGLTLALKMAQPWKTQNVKVTSFRRSHNLGRMRGQGMKKLDTSLDCREQEKCPTQLYLSPLEKGSSEQSPSSGDDSLTVVEDVDSFPTKGH